MKLCAWAGVGGMGGRGKETYVLYLSFFFILPTICFYFHPENSHIIYPCGLRDKRKIREDCTYTVKGKQNLKA